MLLPPARTKILLVDDRREDLLALEASLTSLDQTLVLADSGEQALRRMLADDFALILLDVQMPGLDGFETAKLIKQRERSRHTPIIFLTSTHTEERFTLRGYAAGAVDYVFKPIEPEIIRQKVSVFVDLAQTGAELRRQMLLAQDSRRLIELMVAHAPVALGLLDERLIFRLANPAFATMLGCDIRAIVDAPAQTLLTGMPELLGPLEAQLDEPAPYTSPVPFRRTLGGASRAYSVAIFPIGSTGQDVRGFLIYAPDVTARLENEQLQRDQIETLRNVDRLKDEFLSIISHELRTPINAITGFGSILDDDVAGPLTPVQHEYTRKILKGADRLLALVNDLLDFSKIRAGRLDICREPVDVAELIQDVVADLQTLASDRHIALHADLPGPLIVNADAQRMTQVLLNLVSNAIKYTDVGGRVEIRGAIRDETLVVEVHDSGMGLAAEDLPRLFNPFMQLDMSATRKQGGTGLGLSIAKALVEAHGGTISAISPGLGKGSTFSFVIPLQAPPSIPEAKIPASDEIECAAQAQSEPPLPDRKERS